MKHKMNNFENEKGFTFFECRLPFIILLGINRRGLHLN
jgi:hypothetical protein